MGQLWQGTTGDAQRLPTKYFLLRVQAPSYQHNRYGWESCWVETVGKSKNKKLLGGFQLIPRIWRLSEMVMIIMPKNWTHQHIPHFFWFSKGIAPHPLSNHFKHSPNWMSAHVCIPNSHHFRTNHSEIRYVERERESSINLQKIFMSTCIAIHYLAFSMAKPMNFPRIRSQHGHIINTKIHINVGVSSPWQLLCLCMYIYITYDRNMLHFHVTYIYIYLHIYIYIFIHYSSG